MGSSKRSATLEGRSLRAVPLRRCDKPSHAAMFGEEGEDSILASALAIAQQEFQLQQRCSVFALLLSFSLHLFPFTDTYSSRIELSTINPLGIHSTKHPK